MFGVLHWLACSDLVLFSFAMLSVRPSSHATVDPDEVRRFQLLASKWWDEQGEFAALHAMNDLRVPFIRWVCPLWTLQYSVYVTRKAGIWLAEVSRKSVNTWPRGDFVLLYFNLGVASQVMYIKVDSATHPNTVSACSISTVPALHCVHFLGAAAVLIYKICCWGPAITHPARNTAFPSPLVGHHCKDDVRM